ncbi:2'-5' RNA ligase family protein [Pedobacter sp. MW01-1-1]|uniref:2'-5' RNA ligase family protein n=1 Tax=Pedobacter sp. MW01-1-1 TaxID=3383027 RepID=UPI003FEFEC41
MNLKEHYDKLYTESIAKIGTGNYEIDPLIDDETDKRMGITLVIRPDEKTANRIQHFLSEAKALEPNQYYYANSDMHITTLSIIACYNGFDVANIIVEDYAAKIEKVLMNHHSFPIRFKGLTASPSCVLIQGFLTDSLNAIRDDLRTAFKNSALQQSIDTRYAIQTAHSTVIRFREPLKDEKALINLIEKYRDFDFGTFEVETLELVYNDWYQRKRLVKKLRNFDLVDKIQPGTNEVLKKRLSQK